MNTLTSRLPLRLASAALLLSGLASCTDSEFGAPAAGGRAISFDVTAGRAVASRGGELESVGVSLSLQSGAKTLYLTPEVRGGIRQDGAGSRSVMTDSESMSDFGVYASLTESDATYMDNVKVIRGNSWAPEQEYLWPGKGSLRFTAYSPYVDSPEVNADGEPIIDYQTPADVNDQQSLLWAEPTEASASPCALQFHNALTAIRFELGDEVKLYTLKKIAISGIPSSGRLNITSGDWTETGAPAEFSITTTDDAFLMIPGTMPADAAVSLTVELDGTEYDFTASIGGAEWKAGTTLTYRLSATPQSSGLTLDVIGTFETEYPGQTVPFQVRSALVSAAGDSTAVSWKAEFVDANGNLLDEQPYWIMQFPQSGEGHDDLKAVTRMQDLTFLQLSEGSRILQNAANINQASGQMPYNLANSTGASADENTANCYIINAPGEYSLPLVYGNAIKNGADNKGAYTSTSRNAMAMKTFPNHLGNAISAPYIYDNTGCEPADAILVWEGRLDLIRNVSLSADKKRITFTVPEKSIRQGNAMIAVRDKAGTIMWSWNIWVTDYDPKTETVSYTASGTEYVYYTRNVGRITGGDITEFPHCEVWVRFTQTNVPDGMQPLTKTIDFNQTGITIETSDYYNFYQWGRKDPIKSKVKEWFDADHYEIKSIKTASLPTLTSAAETHIPIFIQHPEVFYVADHNQVFTSSNLWNSSLNAKDNVKTVYDPSPVGAKVPLGNGLLAMIRDTSVTKTLGTAGTGTGSVGLYLDLPSGQRMFLDELGYRSGESGNDAQGVGSVGTLWLAQTPTSSSTAKTEARCVVVHDGTMQQNTNPRTHGFGVRPILE